MESKNKGLDCRTIKCSCDNPNCAETGISFDEKMLRFHYLEEMDGLDGVTQRTKGMYLDKKNVTELIESLQEILETEFNEERTKLPLTKEISIKPFLLEYFASDTHGYRLVYAISKEESIDKLKRKLFYLNNVHINSLTLE